MFAAKQIGASVIVGQALITSSATIGATKWGGDSATDNDYGATNQFTTGSFYAGASSATGTANEQAGSIVSVSTGSTQIRGLVTSQYSADTNSARVSGTKARGTRAVPVAVAFGDSITRFLGMGFDGSTYLESASILFNVDAAVSAGVVPQAIQILTGTGNTPTTRALFNSDGTIAITGGSSGVSAIGSPVTVTAGPGGSTSGAGGDVTIQGGTATDGDGGAATIKGRTGIGTNRAGGLMVMAGGNASGSGTGGSLTIDAGTGGVSGTAGTTTVSGGNGGSTSGAGGAITVQGGIATDGNGGACSIKGRSGVGTNRTGGALALTSGNASGSGAGGALTLDAGTGGTTGTAGTLTISAGNGGSASGAGGALTLRGGSATDGNGGAVNVNARTAVGTNRTGGALSLTGGNATGSGSGGNIAMDAGTGGVTGTAGTTIISAGNGGSTSGAGGAVTVRGGTATDGNGGACTIQGRTAVGTNRTGGALTLTAGNATGSGTGGTISATAGSGGVTGTAGDVTLAGGAGGSTSGNGGNITITAGSATAGVSNGGSVSITPGARTSSGVTGLVNLQGADGTNKIQVNNTGIGFFATTPAAQQAVTTYQSLVTALSTIGLFTISGVTSPMAGQIIYWGGDAGAYAADSVLSVWAPNAHPTTDEAATGQIPVTQAGTVKNLRLHALNGNISVANFIVVIRKNGSDQSLTATITSGAASAADTTHSFTVVEGDLLSVKVTGNGTTVAALGSIWASVEVQ